MRALIIGGGVIGLSIGWQLARRRWRVEIFDRQTVGNEASWTAAGMLAPFSEGGYQEDSEEAELGRKSLALYSRFLAELNADAHTGLSLEKQGTLFVGIERNDYETLEQLFLEQKRKNNPIEWLKGKEARKLEPFLSPKVFSAIWIPEETHIHNRNLLAALKQAFRHNGGIIHENCPVNGLWIEKEKLHGILTQRPVAGDIVINAAGAWASSISKEFPAPVSPNKGQILTLAMREGEILTYMVRTPRVYLVPKSDGSLRIGATSEYVGFDKTVTGGAILELLKAAFEAVPAIASMEFKEAEANLRPAMHGRKPSIGESSLNGYFEAFGHGRAGVLLAPYTSYEIARKVCKSN